MAIVVILITIGAAIGGFTLVNLAYKLYMKIIGADTMYYNGRKKFIYSIVVSCFLWGGAIKLFLGIF